MPWEDVKKEMVNEKGLSEEAADQIGEYVSMQGEISPKFTQDISGIHPFNPQQLQPPLTVLRTALLSAAETAGRQELQYIYIYLYYIYSSTVLKLCTVRVLLFHCIYFTAIVTS